MKEITVMKQTAADTIQDLQEMKSRVDILR